MSRFIEIMPRYYNETIFINIDNITKIIREYRYGEESFIIYLGDGTYIEIYAEEFHDKVEKYIKGEKL